MEFVIAKPSDKMSCGDLFYSVPFDHNLYDYKALYEDLKDFCLQKVKEKFPDNPKMLERLNDELDLVKFDNLSLPLQIIREIAALSYENGYPVATLGAESGSLIMYLIGASSVSPLQYDETTEFYVVQSVMQNIGRFVIAIAEPIRKMLQSRLDKKFGYIDTCNNYKRVGLSSYSLLDYIKELSEKTGYDYNDILLDDSELIKGVYADIYKDLFAEDYNYENELSLDDLVRIFGYARCSHNHKKSKEWFEKLKNTIFCEDLYQAAYDAGFGFEGATYFSKQAIWARDKTEQIERFCKANVSEELISTYAELQNVWPKTCCLSRINPMLIMKFYELNFQKDYKKICDC